jgi:hypothetical protein
MDKLTRPIAIAALAVIVGALPGCGDLKKNTIPVDQVSYRPDGSLVLFTTTGIDVYDGGLLTQMSHVPLDALAVPPFIGEFRYDLSADGNVAAVAYVPNPSISDAAAGMNSRIALYRIPDGELLSMFELPDAPALSYGHAIFVFALSPDAKLLYVTTTTEVFKTWMVDTATGEPVWTTDDAPPVLALWSADGTTLFTLRSGLPNSTMDALDAGTDATKWSTDFDGTYVNVLALVENGTVLTGPAVEPSSVPCDLPGDCPPDYPLWSSADGSLTARQPPVPNTMFTALFPSVSGTYACNATDTCAAHLDQFSVAANGSLQQSTFVRVYRTDGSELQRLPPRPSIPNSMAVSPDGKFVTMADNAGEQGGVTVYRVDDGSVVGSRTFPTDTF